MFRATHNSPEHPIYHPEECLSKHILLVALRAMLATNNIDLILSGFFHDISKPMSGSMVATSSGEYWSNPDHAKQASELVLTNDDVRYMIKGLGGNVDTISSIIRYHMACKESIIKKAKRVPHMDTFVSIDDMIQRKPFPRTTVDITLPDYGKFYSADLSYVGQSPIQRKFKSNQFSVLLNSKPFTYSFQEIPLFFSGKWEHLRFLADMLVSN